ncbi:hypothetical protein [Phascolarctobacterium succinatutens]|uniref:hypothetical protein n=1 Tax=Phascolarctobacterium succinatutens TaxID=626940 RepID=UPI003AF0D248
MKDHHAASEHVTPGSTTKLQNPDTQEIPVDTAKLQAALEKRADQETTVLPSLSMPANKKRLTIRPLSERWWTPSVRSWFFTFMCMNMPIVGWFYLFHKARYEEDPARKEFARAYLFYKLVFFIAGAVVLLILIWIGLGLLDQLLAYMEML